MQRCSIGKSSTSKFKEYDNSRRSFTPGRTKEITLLRVFTISNRTDGKESLVLSSLSFLSFRSETYRTIARKRVVVTPAHVNVNVNVNKNKNKNKNELRADLFTYRGFGRMRR